MGQTSLMTGGTNKKLQTAGGKRTLIQVTQWDQGSLFSHILKILGAFATVYWQYRALQMLPCFLICYRDSHVVANIFYCHEFIVLLI